MSAPAPAPEKSLKLESVAFLEPGFPVDGSIRYSLASGDEYEIRATPIGVLIRGKSGRTYWAPLNRIKGGLVADIK